MKRSKTQLNGEASNLIFYLRANLVQQLIEKILFKNYKKSVRVTEKRSQIRDQRTQITPTHPEGALIIF